MSRSWRELVDLLGEDVALCLAAECGGEQFCMPRTAEPARRLAVARGDAGQFGRMVREWVGCET